MGGDFIIEWWPLFCIFFLPFKEKDLHVRKLSDKKVYLKTLLAIIQTFSLEKTGHLCYISAG